MADERKQGRHSYPTLLELSTINALKKAKIIRSDPVNILQYSQKLITIHFVPKRLEDDSLFLLLFSSASFCNDTLYYLVI